MKEYLINLSRQLGLRLAIVAVAALMGGLIVFAVSLPFHDMYLITKQQDYFWFDGRRISCLCLAGVPLLGYGILMAIFAIFSKSHRSPKRLDAFGSIFAIGSVAMVILLNIIAVAFHFYIIWFTPFSPCNEPDLRAWYVIDHKLCPTLEAHFIY